MADLVRVNATLDRALLDRVDAFAEHRLEDRSTAIRQLLDHALRDLITEESVAAYEGGRITLRELADVLRLSIWATHDLLASRGVAVAQGARAETAGALAAAIDAATASARPGDRE